MADQVASTSKSKRPGDLFGCGRISPEAIRVLDSQPTDQDLAKMLFEAKTLEWLWCSALGLPKSLIRWVFLKLINVDG